MTTDRLRDEWRTVTETAEHFSLSRQRIHQLIQKGALGECLRVPTPVGAYWLIPFPFTRRELPTGRPSIGE